MFLGNRLLQDYEETVSTIISKLKMTPHKEGGYFSETYRSPDKAHFEHFGKRNYMTSIYYMLTYERPIGYFHSNKSDIIHYHQSGSAIRYFLVNLDNEWEEHTLGPDIMNGEVLQLVVPGGYLKASKLLTGNYGLIGEAVSPGFDYSDNIIVANKKFKAMYPQFMDKAMEYILPSELE